MVLGPYSIRIGFDVLSVLRYAQVTRVSTLAFAYLQGQDNPVINSPATVGQKLTNDLHGAFRF